MWKCPTCGSEHKQLQDLSKDELQALFEELSKKVKRKMPNRAKGGFAAAAKLTEEEKSARAKAGAMARWSKRA